MKKYMVCMLVLCGFVSADNFTALHSLTGGVWKMKTTQGYSCEKWTKVSNNELSCVAFDIKGTDTTITERVKLANVNGSINYNVTGAKSGDRTSFRLTSAKNDQFIFEDPKHDFPQRVVYHFIKPDSIHAWVDGKYKGKYEKVDFFYTRVK